ncbi:hypothetical protein ES332_D10G141100v1 [Gossypium tomentosum]|uniref:Uncharacterized protein n=1 Tax=Gossypium tomentosum TaxID=34277 RepID=A0A5D2J625_GOSTO|nr:hypothetical protein ES332_D10G141100v1 [Gossypium tomentosum]
MPIKLISNPKNNSPLPLLKLPQLLSLYAISDSFHSDNDKTERSPDDPHDSKSSFAYPFRFVYYYFLKGERKEEDSKIIIKNQ